MGHPDAFQVADVLGVDFVERRVAGVGKGAAVGEPVLARVGGQFLGAEGRRRSDVADGLAAGRGGADGDHFGHGLLVAVRVPDQVADDEGEDRSGEEGTKAPEDDQTG